MREPRYNILADIQDATEQAKQGKLALYWQRTIQREYRCKKVTPAEQQAYEQLQSVLSEMPQWSDDEELRSEMEEIGGRVRFCHFWTDHDIRLHCLPQQCVPFGSQSECEVFKKVMEQVENFEENN